MEHGSRFARHSAGQVRFRRNRTRYTEQDLFCEVLGFGDVHLPLGLFSETPHFASEQLFFFPISCFFPSLRSWRALRESISGCWFLDARCWMLVRDLGSSMFFVLFVANFPIPSLLIPNWRPWALYPWSSVKSVVWRNKTQRNACSLQPQHWQASKRAFSNSTPVCATVNKSLR